MHLFLRIPLYFLCISVPMSALMFPLTAAISLVNWQQAVSSHISLSITALHLLKIRFLVSFVSFSVSPVCFNLQLSLSWVEKCYCCSAVALLSVISQIFEKLCISMHIDAYVVNSLINFNSNTNADKIFDNKQHIMCLYNIDYRYS